jgi:hypothetical protein
MVDVMGRPVGSTKREKPFNSALLIELRSNPLALRRIAVKLVERAEEGDLAAIREIADRLDGKPAQVIDRRELSIEQLTDAELPAGPLLPSCMARNQANRCRWPRSSVRECLLSRRSGAQVEAWQLARTHKSEREEAKKIDELASDFRSFFKTHYMARFIHKRSQTK